MGYPARRRRGSRRPDDRDHGEVRRRPGAGEARGHAHGGSAPTRQNGVRVRVADPEPALPHPPRPLVAASGGEGLVERAAKALARDLVQDLAHDDDVRARPRRTGGSGVEVATPAPAAPAPPTPTRDERLPRPGHAIVRRYAGSCLGRDAAGRGALDGLRVQNSVWGRAVRLPVGHRQGATMKCWRLAHQRLPVLQAGEGGRMIKPRRRGSATAPAASLENRAIPLAVRIRVDTMPA